jgi:hypothetical protein
LPPPAPWFLPCPPLLTCHSISRGIHWRRRWCIPLIQGAICLGERPSSRSVDTCALRALNGNQRGVFEPLDARPCLPLLCAIAHLPSLSLDALAILARPRLEGDGPDADRALHGADGDEGRHGRLPGGRSRTWRRRNGGGRRAAGGRRRRRRGGGRQRRRQRRRARARRQRAGRDAARPRAAEAAPAFPKGAHAHRHRALCGCRLRSFLWHCLSVCLSPQGSFARRLMAVVGFPGFGRVCPSGRRSGLQRSMPGTSHATDRLPGRCLSVCLAAGRPPPALQRRRRQTVFQLDQGRAEGCREAARGGPGRAAGAR